MVSKVCKRCDVNKEVGEFQKGRNICKECIRAARSAKRNASLDEHRAKERHYSLNVALKTIKNGLKRIEVISTI